MSIGFIPPTLEVLEDRVVTNSEVSWYIQELTSIVISAMIVTLMLGMFDEVPEWQ